MSMLSRIRRFPLLNVNHRLTHHLPKQTCSITTTSPSLPFHLSAASSSSCYVLPNAPGCSSSYQSSNTNISATYTTLITNQYTLQQSRMFSNNSKHQIKPPGIGTGVRLATLLSKHLGLSRRQAERMILTERVTVFGKIVANPGWELFPSPDPHQDSSAAFKVDGKLVQGVDKTLKLLYAEQQQKDLLSDNKVDEDSSVGKLKSSKQSNNEYANTRVWIANKLRGELITEDDPDGRPSMLQRLIRGGVGKPQKKNGITIPTHLKPVGRLDMMTEGLMIFTNDGKYARELELPGNQLFRTYRVRVHGRLTMGKLRAIRQGLTVRINDNAMGAQYGKDYKPSGDVVQTGKLMRYKGMKVSIERKNLSKGGGGRHQQQYGSRGTNTWLRITCTEGKNRQIRRVLNSLGLDATRLIRISYGDYDLNTVPPGRAMEVPCKPLEGMKKKGELFAKNDGKNDEKKGKKSLDVDEENTQTVQWVNYS